MENITYINKDYLKEEQVKDFVSKNLEEEELNFQQEQKRRKFALISLGSIYVLIILTSFVLLT